jgi:cytochrome c
MAGGVRKFAFGGALALAVASLLIATEALAGQEGHSSPESTAPKMDSMDVKQMDELMAVFRSMLGDWKGPRLIMPMMNPARGRKLFASKGCVTCHSINGVGGEDAPALDAHTMQLFMNPFEFAALMWRGAATMIALQEEAMGGQIGFTGEELADIIAFAHDEEEQHKFSEADIPPEIMPMMTHMHAEPGGGAAAHGKELGHENAEEQGHGEEKKHSD